MLSIIKCILMLVARYHNSCETTLLQVNRTGFETAILCRRETDLLTIHLSQCYTINKSVVDQRILNKRELMYFQFIAIKDCLINAYRWSTIRQTLRFDSPALNIEIAWHLNSYILFDLLVQYMYSKVSSFKLREFRNLEHIIFICCLQVRSAGKSGPSLE